MINLSRKGIDIITNENWGNMDYMDYLKKSINCDSSNIQQMVNLLSKATSKKEYNKIVSVIKQTVNDIKTEKIILSRI